MKKTVQAKNITDQAIFKAIEAKRYEWAKAFPMAAWWDIADCLSQFPPKVVRAKLASMVKRKVLKGCPCGCRGDFTPYENPEAS
jgi:hypothetical protein